MEEQHDITNKLQAMAVASERSPMRLGLLYKIEQPDLNSRMKHSMEEAAKRGPGDLEKIMARFG
jgi:hypothetical protein